MFYERRAMKLDMREDGLQVTEVYSSIDHSKRMDNNVLMEYSSDLIELEILLRNEKATYGKILHDLCA